MNRLCYRVIFNKNLGQLVVVSEKTVAAGKSHSPSMVVVPLLVEDGAEGLG